MLWGVIPLQQVAQNQFIARSMGDAFVLLASHHFERIYSKDFPIWFVQLLSSGGSLPSFPADESFPKIDHYPRVHELWLKDDLGEPS
jgi:hypothetical protein